MIRPRLGAEESYKSTLSIFVSQLFMCIWPCRRSWHDSCRGKQRDASKRYRCHTNFPLTHLEMAKGSQLSQLKTALSQAGITGQNKTKKRKRSVAPEKDKEKRAAQLDEIRRRLNPFDVKVTKLKHDVGGRKLKGITGKPAQSKQAGIEQVCGDYGCRN